MKDKQDEITFGDLKKIYKPRLKPMSKNTLINMVIELGLQITELQTELKTLKGEASENSDTTNATE